MLWSFCMCIGVVVSAQENFTGLNDSVINLSCGQACASLNFKVPHLKSSEDYEVVPIPFRPYAFTTPTGNALPLTTDDMYSDVINLPFPICFYGSAVAYDKIVIGSNGLLTFDVSNANCFNAFNIDVPIPSAGNGIQCATIAGDKEFSYYPRAAIMGSYIDLNPAVSANDMKIEWRLEGVAPFRRFVASWYKMSVYGNPTCSKDNPTTFQIVVNEATSVIEVFISQKICTPGTGSSPNSILGIQNWDRNKAVAVTGRNSSVWSAQKEAFRFIPSGTTSRFISSQLVDYATGNVLETATVTETTPGYKDISFTAKCPVQNSEQYIIRTTYAGDCGNPVPIVINDTITINKAVLPVTATATRSGCAVGTGSITAMVATGAGVTGPYVYQLNPGAITINSADPTATFNNLAPGFYNLTVTGAGSCSNTISNIEVVSSGTFDVSYIVNPPSCVGAQNASIVLTPPAGGGPYSYSINGSPKPSNVITGLPASGPYQVRIWTSPTCEAFVTIPMIPAGTGVLTGTVAPTATTCLGVNNGSITATPTSGSGPYQYSIDNGQTWQNGNTFNNLAAGNYNVLIKEGACTSGPLPATIPAGAGLNVSLTSNPASCPGARDGNLAVNITTGTTPYTVSITGATTFTQTITTNTLVLAGLGPGDYFVAVRDANGCTPATNPGKVTVGAGTGFNITAASVPVSCFGGNNGSLTITPSAPAGTSPYTFTLNGTITQTGAANTVFNGLTAGDYSIRVTDAVGCEIVMSNLVVTQPAVLAIPPPAVQAPLCNGDDNGMITVNPTGGNPPYTYSLNGSAFQPANTFKVSAGAYSVRVLDSKNCGALYSNITVAAPAALSASVSSTANATCEGGANGSITVTATGGSGNYQYSSGGAFQSSNVLNVLAGTYTVTVKDVNGCLFTIPDVTVGLTNNLSFTPAVDPAPICEGTSVTLQLTTNATSFSWTPNQPGIVNDATVANAVVHPSVTTLFHVTMRLGVCTAQDEVNVRVMPAPVPNAGPDGEICFGQNYQLQASGGIRYEWTPQRYLSDPFNSSPQVLQPDRTITYSVTATDANNCSSLAPDEITITVIPPIKIKVSPADTVVYAGDKFQLTASSIASNYTWTPATGLSNAFIADPVVTAPSVDGAVVRYEVTASTAAGCKGEGEATVRVYKGPEIYVANAFSPNNDGKNDVFIPFPVGIKQLKYFRVFNRWGQMMFSTTTLQQGWDGRFGGQDQPGGVYTWMVEAITHDDRKITKKGTVTLIR